MSERGGRESRLRPWFSLFLDSSYTANALSCWLGTLVPEPTRRNTLHQNAPSCHQVKPLRHTTQSPQHKRHPFGPLAAPRLRALRHSRHLPRERCVFRRQRLEPSAHLQALRLPRLPPCSARPARVNRYTYVLPAAARKLRAAKPKNGRAKGNLSDSVFVHEGSKRAAGPAGCTHQRHPGQGGPALRSRRQGHPLTAEAIWLAFLAALLRHSVASTAPVARDISLLPGSSAAVAGSRSSGLPLRAALAAGTQARTHCWSRNCATLSRGTSPAPRVPSA